jgi:hypothetical protein
LDYYGIIDNLFARIPDSDTYFECLATLQRSRLKFQRILQYQPLPTMDQVGPRALLQFGQMSPRSLAAFLFWRKFLFDIDNRSGQETGYLFEPIIANAIGGASFSASRSPIKRQRDNSRGRQVDCIRGSLAYEIKIRVTIAASGQGRWQEELEFPSDCRRSGFDPVLIVLDPTPNSKLSNLVAAFAGEHGQTYIGNEAWRHLEDAAGPTMAVFLDKYVKAPIKTVLDASPGSLPDITFRMTDDALLVSVEDEAVEFRRGPTAGIDSEASD